MKVKAGEVVEAVRALGNLSKVKMPAKAAYWVSRMSVKLAPEAQAIETQRVELVKKHGKTNDNGDSVVGPEGMSGFMSEFSVVLSEEIEIEVHTIKAETFGDANIEPSDLIAIDKFISE